MREYLDTTEYRKDFIRHILMTSQDRIYRLFIEAFKRDYVHSLTTRRRELILEQCENGFDNFNYGEIRDIEIKLENANGTIKELFEDCIFSEDFKENLKPLLTELKGEYDSLMTEREFKQYQIQRPGEQKK